MNHAKISQQASDLLTNCDSDYQLRHLLLYFIRLSLHNLENMLFAYLGSQNQKVRRSRRTAFHKLIENRPAKNAEDGYSLADRSFALFDFSESYSTKILQELPENEQAKLFHFLRDDRGLSDLKEFDQFLQMIFLLRSYRGFFEHYAERIAKNKFPKEPEDKLFYTLGRVLLPYSSGLLQGKLGQAKWQDHNQIAIDQIKTGRTQRRFARYHYASTVKTKKGGMAKERRIRLHKDTETFKLKYLSYFSDTQSLQAYNLSNFRDAYFGLGPELLGSLQKDSGAKSFPVCEALYKAYLDAGLCLALRIGFLEEKWQQTNPIGKRGFSAYVKSLPLYQTNRQDCDNLITIRNHIAHGRLVLAEEDPYMVFSTLFTLLAAEQAWEQYHLLYDHLLRLCRRGEMTIIWQEKDNPDKPKAAPRWTKQMARSHWRQRDRNRLADLRSQNVPTRSERFHGLRHKMAIWVKAINQAYDKDGKKNIAK